MTDHRIDPGQARARLLAALAAEDDTLAGTIKAIRTDQRDGHLSDAEAAANVATAKVLHRSHTDLLTAAYQFEVPS